jgi:hypothetical protein
MILKVKEKAQESIKSNAEEEKYWREHHHTSVSARGVMPMKHEFKVGDHVEWNSEAGRVRGTIQKKVTSAIKFKTYTVHASKDEPQYLIKSDKTDHMAVHKGAALKKLSQKKPVSRS